MRLSALLLLFACASSAATVSYRPLQSGGMAASRSAEQRAFAAADAKTYAALWSQLVGTGAPLDVDFAKESVVFLLAGERPTGGHSIEVSSVAPDGSDGVVVTAAVKPPPPDSMNIQILTYPYNVIAVAKPGVTKVRWAGK